MKLIGKIVVILIAALMVAGATLALDNSGALSSLSSGGPGERGERPADADAAFAPGERLARGGEGDEGDRDSLPGSLLSMGRNVALIAAVVGGVGVLGWLAGQAATRRKLANAPLPKEKAPPEQEL